MTYYTDYIAITIICTIITTFVLGCARTYIRNARETKNPNYRLEMMLAVAETIATHLKAKSKSKQ